MKRNAILSVLLVLCMLFAATGTALALTIDGAPVKNYLALGGSVANGYGAGGSSYSQLMGISNTTVKAENGFRVEELALLLSDSRNGDSYTNKYFPNLKDRRSEIRDAVKKADFITVDIGADNFGKFIKEQLETGAFSTDLSKVVSPDKASNYQLARTMLNTMLVQQWNIPNDANTQKLLAPLSYALFSYMDNFDAIISAIKELNPKAKILVVSISYPLTGLDLPVSLPANVDILKAFVDMANLYAACESPYLDSYFYAYFGNVSMTAEGAYQYPNAQGHQQLKDSIETSAALKINGAQYFDILDQKVVSNMTGYETKLPSQAAQGGYISDGTVNYVAIGDSFSYSGGYSDVNNKNSNRTTLPFPKKLANAAGFKLDYLTPNAAFSADGLAAMDGKEALLKNADLVTIGYGINSITWDFFSNLRSTQGKQDLPWEDYLDADGIAMIEDALKELKQEFIDRGLNITIAGLNAPDVMAAAVERYLFEVVSLMTNYPRMVAKIHEQNPNATVVLVGMHNPMAELIVKYTPSNGGEETLIPMSTYMGMMADAVNSHYQLYAMTHDNVIFVEAAEVDTVYKVLIAQSQSAEPSIGIVQFVMQLITPAMGNAYRYDATDAGVDYVANQIKSALHAHDYKAVVTDPTCTEAGYTTHTCSKCGDSYKDTFKDATGHSMGGWQETKAPTCTEKGSEENKCSKCSHTETRDKAALNHSYSSTVTEPTCTEEGYTTHTCSRCGDSYTDSYVAALSHSYIPTVTEPTCTEEGYTTFTCQCGHSYKDDVKPALGHTDGDFCGRCGISLKWGDLDNSGGVNIQDAITLLRYVAKLVDGSSCNSEMADVNGDGAVNIQDAIMVLRYVAKLIPELPGKQ